MPLAQIKAEQLRAGCIAFASREHRDAMYRIAVLLVNQTWGKPAEVADALGVILLTWNQAFYRYGPPDFDHIESFLRARENEIFGYREGHELARLSDRQIDSAAILFEDLLDATQIRTAKTGEVRRSPVSAAKALHVLAPSAFPIWDDRIRTALGFGGASRTAPTQYLRFMHSCRATLQGLSQEQPLEELAAELSELGRFPKTILKFLDEYFYALYTKHWI